MLASADGLLQPASWPAKASLPVRICQRIFQASKNSSHHASGDFVRGLDVGANFREASPNDAKMASPETTETADATMYEKARTSVLLPKRNV